MNLNGNPMKTRVFFLALAVVAAAIAPSCVKEEFGSQDNSVEITGQVFEANHEVLTKSTLVGLTPTWTGGDVITVWGGDGKSAACTYVEGNKFQTEEGITLAPPYYAVYPAAKGYTLNRETGVFTASVPAIQKITKGHNVAQGALVAVAASDDASLYFKNAVGLVKLNIARNDIMAVKIEALGEDEYVSGQFTMTLDGDEPAVTLVEGTGVKNVILNPEKEYGVFTPGEYYATVLPCNLSGIIVSFTRKTINEGEDGEITTGTETINVRKQAQTVIKRNEGYNLGNFFVYEIGNANDLVDWNKAAAKWTVWDVVTLTDDIDCKNVVTSDNWTPNEFKGVFDGNGKTINNFVIEKAGHAAFFKKLQSAVVKNLTFGEGCSFISTAPVSNTVYAASLAGEVRGGCTITGVENKGAVTVGSTSGTNGDYVGGICAYFLADSDSQMTDCKNYGNVTYSATTAGPVYCAGVAAVAATKVDLTMTGCENHGTVLFTGNNAAAKDINLGGITGIANKVNFASCVNLGSIHSNATETNAGATNLGGIVGVMNTACGTITNCVNGASADASKGALTNDSPASGVVRMGGFVGSIINNPINVTGFKNYGAVTNNGAVGNWNTLGGVVGYVGGISSVNTISGCENHGVVTNTKVVGRVSLGGVVGMIQKAKTNVIGNTNKGKVTNTGDAPTNIGVTLGGIVGRIEALTNGENTLQNNTNSGDVLFHAASAYDANMLSGVAGILGGHAGNIASSAYQPCTLTIDNCTNIGKVEKTGAGASNMFVGGIAAFLNGTAKSNTHVANVTNCTNGSSTDASKGAVLNGSSGSGSWTTFTGGIVGYYRILGELKGCNNYGSVKNTSSAQLNNSFVHFRLGGIVGSSENGTITNCLNAGAVTDDSETNAGCVGGVVGCVANAATLTNCDNSGDMTVKFNSSDNPFPMDIAGVVGYAATAITLEGCDNYGDITNNRTTTALNIYMGGLLGQAANDITVKDCEISGNLTNNASGGKLTMGAIVGICYNNTISNCHSTMSVNNTYANQYIGGFIGQVEANKTSNISNCSVAADVVSKGSGYSGMFVGRLTDQDGANKGGITTTLSNIWVKGSFEGTGLTADNYKTYCYGTGSDYKVTDQISFGDFQ